MEKLNNIQKKEAETIEIDTIVEVRKEQLIIVNEKNEEVLYYHYDEKAKILTYPKRQDDTLSIVCIALKDIHLSLQEGNTKVGRIMLLNTLPGENPIKVKGVEITNVLGTCHGCGGICERYCYSVHGCQQHHNSVMPSVLKNTILYREDPERFNQELRTYLKHKVEVHKKYHHTNKLIFRWHASGEIESPQYLRDMMDVAPEFPEIHFYSYTKRFKWIEEYLDEFDDFPKNFVWNLSVWKNNLKESGFPDKYLCKVQLFEWDDFSDDHLVHVIHCPAVKHDGKSKKGKLNHEPFSNGKERNCENCGICWMGYCKGKTIAVGNH